MAGSRTLAEAGRHCDNAPRPLPRAAEPAYLEHDFKVDVLVFSFYREARKATSTVVVMGVGRHGVGRDNSPL
jgi:hypothetical protein